MITSRVVVIACLSCLCAGCWLCGPNHNDKMRYSMALGHADRALREVGCDLSYSDDYALMEFWRVYYDERENVLHELKLYDFLKTAKGSGPDRFVIAYDFVRRQTYLRADLRSDENLERLDWASTPTTTSRVSP